MIREKRISFGASMSNMHAVNHFIEDICDHYNIFDSYFGNILTAVTEAVQNAIVHGNRSNPSKRVELSFTSRADGLCFTVSDEGNGFNPNEMPDPTDLANDGLMGRGIFLMHSLADGIEFSDGGRTVELTFNITGIDQDLAASRMTQMNTYFKSVKKTTGTSIQ
ncbi:MAG: ATP-binding protein [Bacteroidales bacterium]